MEALKKNILKHVIIRLDFAIPLNQIKETIPQAINKAIIKEFPILEPQNILPSEIKFQSNDGQQGEPKLKTHDGFKLWIYFGKNREKRLELDQEHFVIIDTNYSSYEKFYNTFINIVSSLLEEYPDLNFKRFGLRYVNEIELNESNPLQWENHLNDNFLSIFNIYPEKRDIARAFQVLSLNKGDFNVNFQYGMHNPDYPATIKRKLFTLDFDAYKHGLIENKTEINESLTAFRKEIKKLFDLSIKPELKEQMELPSEK